MNGWIAFFATVIASLLVGCMPASWGAGGLLHPSRRPLRAARPAAAEEVTIAGDGVKLKGWLFRGEAPRRGTVIYLHGSADNRASGMSIAERFLARGFDALIYDSRAHGESEGAACTYGYFEKKDLMRAIDFVSAKPIVAIGVSLGGAVALQAAAEDRRIATVIAVATFCDLRTIAASRAPFFANRKNIDAAFRLAESQAHFRVDDVSPLDAASRITVPVLLIHGQADAETPSWHSQRVYEAIPGEKRLLLVPGAGHNNTLRTDVWNEVDTWVDKIVPR